MLSIERVSNGWLIISSADDNYYKVVVEIGDEESDAEAFIRVLYTALDDLGPTTSRYDKYIVSIGTVHGDKFND